MSDDRATGGRVRTRDSIESIERQLDIPGTKLSQPVDKAPEPPPRPNKEAHE